MGVGVVYSLIRWPLIRAPLVADRGSLLAELWGYSVAKAPERQLDRWRVAVAERNLY
jgi:xanthosine utilization system XapX-like protein